MADDRLKPNEVGEFTGLYGIQVHTCNKANNIEASNPSVPLIYSTQTNSFTDVVSAQDWALLILKQHKAYHSMQGTLPCESWADPVSTIHKNAVKPQEVIWVPVIGAQRLTL